MAHERMIDKNAQPSDADMMDVIGPPLAGAWIELRRFLVETYDIVPLLQYGGKRYGWNVQRRKRNSRPTLPLQAVGWPGSIKMKIYPGRER